MNFQQAIEYIEDSDQFKQFHSDNSDFKLAHGFCTVEKETPSPWELGYYSAKTDKIVVFVAGESVEQRPEEEPFKKEGVVQTLDPKEVKFSLDDALARLDELRADESIKGEPVTKILVILQVLDGVTMWNMTAITMAFNMMNVRLDSSSGEVLKSEISSIMNLGNRV